MNIARATLRLIAVLSVAAALAGQGGERFKPGSWLGIRVGKTSLAAARQKLGDPKYSGPLYYDADTPTDRQLCDTYVIDKPLAGRLQVYAMNSSPIISAMEFTPTDQDLHLSDMEHLLGAKLVARQYEWCPAPGGDVGGSWFVIPNPAGTLFFYEDLAHGLSVHLSRDGTVEVVEFLGKPPLSKCPPLRAQRTGHTDEGRR